ncbi:Lipase (class 3), putative [Leishmania guyanensis]|uniref:Fungal lipase-type domain-containing protein n=1 Tax=Leishmania guyanensis TaxID=5670 RepID=A0A1E1IRE1_LEIGU|nr:hypothetical protein, unknown function [Leishmania guyanensis]
MKKLFGSRNSANTSSPTPRTTAAAVDSNKRDELYEAAVGDGKSGVLNKDGDTSGSTMTDAASIYTGGRQGLDPAKRHGSCYIGGTNGRCGTCGLSKIACNCQTCHCCGRFLMSPSSRRHCRQCWRATCADCSTSVRTNDFMGGRVTLTCNFCAVPKALCFVTQMRYSSYDTVGAVDLTMGNGAVRNDDVGAKPPQANMRAAMEPCTFRWGVYALGCAIESPRRCINPSCPAPLSYAEVCVRCKMPTVVMTFHDQRHIVMQNTSVEGKRPDANDSSVRMVEAVEDAVRSAYDNMAASRTSADEEEIFASALPSGMETQLFSSALSGPAVRKVLLSLVACYIAGESSGTPCVSLALTDLPLYGRLLRPTNVTELFTVFDGPGRTRFISFSSGTTRRPALHQVLGTRMVPRELWSNATMKKENVVGKVVGGKEAARKGGLNTNVATWTMRAGLLAYMAEDNIMDRVQSLALRIVKSSSEVVICGHGVGGAAAAWLTTCLLLENTPETRDRLMCVTFGAPLIASQSLSEVLVKNDLAKNFHHFVYGSDMVPRLCYVDSLLLSGNTAGCTLSVGLEEEAASGRRVQECTAAWVALHEEPHNPADIAQAMAEIGDDNLSLTNFSSSAQQAPIEGPIDAAPSDKKESSKQPTQPADTAARTAATAMGDLFLQSREPFGNTSVRTVHKGDEDAQGAVVAGHFNVRDADFKYFSSQQHRDRQVMDPFGFYHFLWHPRKKYMCTDDPKTIIAMLSDRTELRIQLSDHLLSSYNKGMLEYMYSACPE